MKLGMFIALALGCIALAVLTQSCAALDGVDFTGELRWRDARTGAEASLFIQPQPDGKNPVAK